MYMYLVYTYKNTITGKPALPGKDIPLKVLSDMVAKIQKVCIHSVANSVIAVISVILVIER